MEVHAHTHTQGKKFTHYLWEFLMLFLAVFAGFLAENQREHLVEHQREKQYMRSMIKDIEADIKNIDSNLRKKTISLRQGDSLILLLSKPDYHASTSLVYYFGRMLSTRQFFFMTDGTMMQLKNSGGLRLIRQQNVVDSLQAYDNIYNLFIENQQLEELQLIDYRNVLVKIFDARILETMTKDNLVFHMPEGNPPLFNTDKALLNELMVRIHFIKRNITNNYNYLKLLHEKGIRIIELIKEKYHLE